MARHRAFGLTNMPTLKQKTAFKKMVKNMGSGNPQTMGQVLIASGYDLDTANKPSQVITSQGFQALLAKIDDETILNRFKEILVDEDKRASLQAGVELLKLKDRYPKEATKFTSLFTSIRAIRKDEDEDSCVPV